MYRRVLTFIYKNMESSNVFDENNAAKRLYASKGDTPGKAERKARRRSRNGNAISSRALFQNSGTSPKVQFCLIYYTYSVLVFIYVNKDVCMLKVYGSLKRLLSKTTPIP